MAEQRRPLRRNVFVRYCEDCEHVHPVSAICLPNPSAPCPACHDRGVIYHEDGTAWACDQCPTERREL